MQTFLTIIHIFVCLFLVGVVLLQSGRAGGMGVLSGAATQTVFGGRGAGGFLATATAVCAGLFMVTSASLAFISTSGRDSLARAHGGNRPAAVSNTGTNGNRPAAPSAAPTPAPAAPSAAPAAPSAAPVMPDPVEAAPSAAPSAAPAAAH